MTITVPPKSSMLLVALTAAATVWFAWLIGRGGEDWFAVAALGVWVNGSSWAWLIAGWVYRDVYERGRAAGERAERERCAPRYIGMFNWPPEQEGGEA